MRWRATILIGLTAVVILAFGTAFLFREKRVVWRIDPGIIPSRTERLARERGQLVNDAIHMWRLDHSFPDTLDPILKSSEFKMPVNPFTGEPMRLVKLEDASPGNLTYIPRRFVIEYLDGTKDVSNQDYLFFVYSTRSHFKQKHPPTYRSSWEFLLCEYPVLWGYDSGWGSTRGTPDNVKSTRMETWTEALRRTGYDGIASKVAYLDKPSVAEPSNRNVTENQ